METTGWPEGGKGWARARTLYSGRKPGTQHTSPRGQHIRSHLPPPAPRLRPPSPNPGLPGPITPTSSFSLPASTLFPMSEGPEGSSQSRVLICHIYCRFPAPAHDPRLSTRLFWKRPICQQIEDSSNTLGIPSQGQGQGPRGSRCNDACSLRKAKASRGRGGGRPWGPLYLSLVASWE